LDWNGLQQFGWVLAINEEHRGDRRDPWSGIDLRGIFERLGWRCLEINGHDYSQIIPALQSARASGDSDQPTMIIAHTVKGKGVHFTEGKHEWHPNPYIFRRSIVEFRFRKLHNSVGLAVFIVQPIANVPMVNGSGAVRSCGWAHALKTVRLHQVRMSRTQPVTDKLRFDLRVAFGKRIPAHYEAGQSCREQYQLPHNVSSFLSFASSVVVLYPNRRRAPQGKTHDPNAVNVALKS
jgi:hypothetical protein